MMTTFRAKALDAQTFARTADWLAAAVAAALPWSTSLTGILITLWLIAILPTLNAATLRRELASAAGGLPVLLWVLAAVGMLWADVAWSARLDGLGGFNRLLLIPLLLAQFRRSPHADWVLYGFFASVLAVLLLSWAIVLLPNLPWRGKEYGVPVKDYIIQGTEFLICAFVLFGLARDDGETRRWHSAAVLVGLAVLFIANIVFVATGRTVLLVAPALVLLFGWRQAGWKGLLGAALIGCILAGAVWLSSPYLRARLLTSFEEFQAYQDSDAVNSTSLHLEYLKKSLSIVASAPIIGHGTGSIAEQFRNVAVGETGAASTFSVNPHNQIFAVAIQIGLLGAVVLLAMWSAHFMLFRGGGLAAWTGALIVTQNVVASLVNTHLFDFTQGWLYVFGVGVAGGRVLRERDLALAARTGAKR